MRILFLSQLLPLPLDAGPKVRAYYVLRHLVESGHDVSLLCFVRPTDRPADIEILRAMCADVVTVPLQRSRLRDLAVGMRSVVSAVPFLIQRDQLQDMDNQMHALLAKGRFDAVHADQLWMAPYAQRAAVGTRVLDQHNAVFKVPERMARHHRNPIARSLLRNEATKLESFERDMCARFEHVVWVSDEDRNAFTTSVEASQGTHDVIPIAVDPVARQPVVRDHPFRVTFLGGMHWPPNAEGARWFVERAWSRIEAAVPEAVLTVIGKGNVNDIATHASSGRIEVTGYVPELETYLRETAVFVVPLLAGAGMRVKILDAWCWGIPVVSTSLGAEGIDVADGDNMLVADDPTDFATRVIDVMTNGALSKRVGESGRATVESLYDWRKVYRAWNRVYH